jgi:hypothetical protein
LASTLKSASLRSIRREVNSRVYATRSDGKRCLERVEAQGFQAAAGNDQYQKAGQGDVQRPPIDGSLPVQTSVTPPHEDQQQHNPPPGGKAENVEHQVGQPGATAAGRVVHRRRVDGVRPARVVGVVTPERKRQKAGDNDQDQPTRFLEEERDFLGQGTRRSRGIGDSAGKFVQ